MEETLAEVEFLALSANRVRVLGSLAEGNHTRTELAEVTGASQATLGRILEDFRDRHWIQQADEGYGATVTGRLVAEEVRDLLGVIDTERDLRGIIEYLPTDAMEFDFRSLADATIVTPSQTRPNAPLQRLLTLLRDAENVTTFSHAFNDQSLSTVADRVGKSEFRAVLTRGAVDALAADDELRGCLRTVVAAETASLRVYDGEIPLAVTVADDVVNILARDDDGVLQASVDTDHPEVVEWAQRRFEHYRVQSEPLTLEALAD